MCVGVCVGVFPKIEMQGLSTTQGRVTASDMPRASVNLAAEIDVSDTTPVLTLDIQSRIWHRVREVQLSLYTRTGFTPGQRLSHQIKPCLTVCH